MKIMYNSLIAAINSNKIEIATALIKLLKDQVAAFCNHALLLAAKNGHLEILKALLQIEAVRKEAAALDNLALRLAAQNGHLDVVKELFEIEAVRKYAILKGCPLFNAGKGRLVVLNNLLK